MKTVTASELLILDARQFQKEHEDWQQNAFGYDWWDGVYEYFKETCDGLGIRVDQIAFSGFWSQGDGAAFEGRVDLTKFMEHKGLHIEHPALYLAVKDDGSYFLVRCSRTNNMRGGEYECYANQTAPSGIFEGLDQEAWEELVEVQEEDAQLEDAALEYCKELAGGLYRDLETEYEYLTSEESFIESCDCNEITFELETEAETS
jgi:hypothetical protein